MQYENYLLIMCIKFILANISEIASNLYDEPDIVQAAAVSVSKQ